MTPAIRPLEPRSARAIARHGFSASGRVPTRSPDGTAEDQITYELGLRSA